MLRFLTSFCTVAVLAGVAFGQTMGPNSFMIDKPEFNPAFRPLTVYDCKWIKSYEIFHGPLDDGLGLDCVEVQVNWETYAVDEENLTPGTQVELADDWCNKGPVKETCASGCAKTCKDQIPFTVPASSSKVSTEGGIEFLCDCSCAGAYGWSYKNKCKLKNKPPDAPWCTTYNCIPECVEYPDCSPVNCQEHVGECLQGCPGWPDCLYCACTPEDCCITCGEEAWLDQCGAN